MKIQIARLPIPELEFGGAGFFQDPRLGLAEAGPFDARFGCKRSINRVLPSPRRSLYMFLLHQPLEGASNDMSDQHGPLAAAR